MMTNKTMKEVKNITWSTKEMVAKIDKELFRFDSFVQRRRCWDNERESLLIRSMINGFPRIPELYATKDTENASYQCLDGQQRSMTVYDFVKNNFTLGNIEPVIDEDGVEYELSGKKFEELDPKLQDVIQSYIFRIAYYDDLSDDEQAELFFLINNSKGLTAVEHNRSTCKSLKEIQIVGSHKLFTAALTAKAFEKYTHEDMVVKAYIMLNHETPCLDMKVVRPTMASLNLTEDDIASMNKIFDRIHDAYTLIVSDNNKDTMKMSKKIAKRLITRTHLLSIIPIVEYSLNKDISTEAFVEWVKNFYNGTKSPTKYTKYNDKASSGSNHTEAIRVRLEVIEKDFKTFMKNHEIKKATKVVETPAKTETVETTETVNMTAQEVIDKDKDKNNTNANEDAKNSVADTVMPSEDILETEEVENVVENSVEEAIKETLENPTEKNEEYVQTSLFDEMDEATYDEMLDDILAAEREEDRELEDETIDMSQFVETDDNSFSEEVAG